MGLSVGEPFLPFSTSSHRRFAVPADDACAIIGCMVSLRFSTNIFQLQLCRQRKHPPVISSSPSGERSARKSMEESEPPKNSLNPSPLAESRAKTNPRYSSTLG